MSSVTLEVIDDVARLRAFEPEWQQFLDRCPPPTPFQRPEWLLTWWQHFGSGALRVFIFRAGSQMAGVAPCFLHDWRERRQLTLMGTGVTDNVSPVLDPANAPAAVEELRKYLLGSADWQIVDWQDLAADTPLAALYGTVEDTPCSAVDLTFPFDVFLQSRPKVLLKNLRRSERKRGPTDAVEFEVSGQADGELITALIDLHGARWRQSGQSGMVEANHLGGFLKDVAGPLARRDILRFFTLRFNGRVAAIILALRNDTTLFGYLTAFDPGYKSYEFGTEMLAFALRHGHEKGYRTWNFLRGDEPYKAAWGALPIPKRRLTFTPEELAAHPSARVDEAA